MNTSLSRTSDEKRPAAVNRAAVNRAAVIRAAVNRAAVNRAAVNRAVPALLFAYLAGCTSEMVVAEPDAGDDDVREVPEDSSSVIRLHDGMGGSGCQDTSSFQLEMRNAWVSTNNHWGGLANTSWKGRAHFPGSSGDGQDIALRLGEQEGSFDYGEVHPLDADEALFVTGNWLPFSFTDQYLSPGTFPLHGGSYHEGELVLAIDPKSVMDPWCNLQTPYEKEDGACDFQPYPHWEWDKLEEDQVDCFSPQAPDFARSCAWFEQVDECLCVTNGCFALVRTPEVKPYETLLDYSDEFFVVTLTYDPESKKLEGPAALAGEDYYLELELQ